MKNEVENQSNFHCLLESTFYLILVEFGGKMEASWHQNRSKIDVGIEKRCFEKNSFFLKRNKTLWGRGGSIAHFVPDLILWRVEEGGG